MSIKQKKEKRTLITKCPECGSRNFVINAFGSICKDCLYEEKIENDMPKDNLKEKIVKI